jgi:hypothetical protein
MHVCIDLIDRMCNLCTAKPTIWFKKIYFITLKMCNHNTQLEFTQVNDWHDVKLEENAYKFVQPCSPDFNVGNGYDYLPKFHIKPPSAIFFTVAVRHSANAGWSLHISTNPTLPSQQGVAINPTKQNPWPPSTNLKVKPNSCKAEKTMKLYCAVPITQYTPTSVHSCAFLSCTSWPLLRGRQYHSEQSHNPIIKYHESKTVQNSLRSG